MIKQLKTRKTFYLLLAIIGTLLPIMLILPFMLEQSLTPLQLMSAIVNSPVSSMLAVNVIVGCITLAVLMHTEGRELEIKTWPPMLAISTIGISSGLPLYFYLRERANTNNE